MESDSDMWLKDNTNGEEGKKYNVDTHVLYYHFQVRFYLLFTYGVQ